MVMILLYLFTMPSISIPKIHDPSFSHFFILILCLSYSLLVLDKNPAESSLMLHEHSKHACTSKSPFF